MCYDRSGDGSMRKETVKVILVIVAFYLVIELLGITCPIRFLSGISCAGCGMSRAWLAALRLDFGQAFSMHPLFLMVPLAAIVWLLRKRLPKKLVDRLGVAALTLFLAVYVLRLMDPTDTVVTCSLRDGWVIRLLTMIFHR